MSNAKQTEMIITLSCRGEDLYSLNARDFIEEISIGRNSDCTWSVGHVDSATSGRHAMISKRKNDLFLTDLGSRNGIYLNERKIKEIKLAPGMIFHFGECTMTTTDPSVKNTVKLKPCYLRYTDENGKRRKFKVSAGSIKIGSGGKCDIVLNSGLVSTPHISLHRKKDGSCWVKDLNSRNGTSVNGLELPGKTERMLKNGDIISVADVDITFYDGTAERHTLKLTAALATLLATGVVCVGGYFFWLQFTPASQEFLQQARAAARESDFAGARRLVAHAATARKSGDTSGARKLLLSQIDVWENSARRWGKLNELLSNSRFGEVPQLLGTMDLEYISAWDWNETNAVKTKQDLELYKKLFFTFNRAEMVFSDREAEPEVIDALIAEIAKGSALLRNQPQPGKQKLLIFAEGVSKKLAIVRNSYNEYAKVTAQLRDSDSFVLPDVIAGLEKIKRSCPIAFIAGRVEVVLPVLYALQSSEKQLLESKKLLNGMHFKECIAFDVVVPDNKLQLAGLDKRIANLKKESEALKNVAAHLNILKTGLERQGVKPGKNLASLTAFANEKDLEKVFKCDSLSLAPAPKNRKKAVGVYDKYVGIEYLYSTLVMIRSYDTVRSRYSIPFEPIIEQAAFHMGGIRYFKEYTASQCSKFIVPGKLRDFITYLDSQVRLRDEIVKNVKKRLAKLDKGKREYFIAHGIAYALDPQGYSYTERESIAKEFSAFRVSMQELNRKYNTVMPEEAIKIRDQILKSGLPGDPVVKRMWSLR